MRFTPDTLGDDEVLVVGIALDSYRGAQDLLSDPEGARFRRMRSTAKRREFLAGRSAMRRVVGALVETEPRDVRFEFGAHGKPVLFLHPKDFNGALVELEQV